MRIEDKREREREMKSNGNLLGWWEEKGTELLAPRRRYNDDGAGGTGDGDDTDEVDMWLVVSDLIITNMWVWSAALVKVACTALDGGEVFRWSLYIVSRFLFAWFGTVTGGGAHHSLTVIAAATSDGFSNFRFSVLWRVLAQVVGYTAGVKQVSKAFPGIPRGPQLKVGIPRGMLTESFLSFMFVVCYLGLKTTAPTSSVKILTSSVFWLTLNNLGSDITGGSMNPAKAFAWAFHRGNCIDKEQLLVYWLAPLLGTAIAIWAVLKVARPKRKKKD